MPVNVADVAHKIDGGPFSGLYFGAAVGLSRAYPAQIDTDALLTPAGKRAFAQIGKECLLQFAPQYAFQRLECYTVGGVDPTTVPSIAAVVRADELGQHVPRTPLYVYMAAGDEILSTPDVDALVGSYYCTHGAKVEYVHDLLSDHNTLAVTGAAAAMDYLNDRFAGKAAPSTCATGPITTASTQLDPRALATLAGAIAGFPAFY